MMSFIREFAPPTFGALASLYLSVRHTNNKSKKAVVIQILDQIITNIESVAEGANLYYMSEDNDETRRKALIIQHKIGSISREVADLCKNPHVILGDNNSPKATMIKFRQAVTGGSFQSASRIPLARSDQRYVDISTSRDALISALRQAQFSNS